MNDWDFLRNRIAERLWVKPLIFCVASIGFALLARMADGTGVSAFLPNVTRESVETLLDVMSSSMLVIATFAVASMVAAYASASSTATPRSFPLVVADDVSQNALSTFVGAFIFSIVALLAIQNGYFGRAGRFVLFALTLVIFAMVIVTFVRWVDSIARLGRLGSTVKRVESAAHQAFMRRREAPHMGGVPPGPPRSGDEPIYAEAIGYVQRVDLPALQAIAEAEGVRFRLSTLPGAFAAPGRALLHVLDSSSPRSEESARALRGAFLIGDDRTFDEDPRFGLIVLSEIACRALSPAVNDPGSAIDVIGSLVRLFADWSAPLEESGPSEGEASYPLIEVPTLSLDDMFDDAFRAIARDGAGTIEVVVRLQKALQALAEVGQGELRGAAFRQALAVRGRAEAALVASDDLTLMRRVSQFADAGA